MGAITEKEPVVFATVRGMLEPSVLRTDSRESTCLMFLIVKKNEIKCPPPPKHKVNIGWSLNLPALHVREHFVFFKSIITMKTKTSAEKKIRKRQLLKPTINGERR